MIFKDRFEAGQKLAQQLQEYKNNPDVVILAIPRGALVIGSVLSHQLHAPLDVVLTKKIGYPGNPEYAIGAASLHNIILDKRVVEMSGDVEAHIKEEVAQIRAVLHKRAQEYHQGRDLIPLKDKIVILTDDGIATGKTIELTIDLLKKQGPKKIIIAVPVASREAMHLIKKKVDEVVCLFVPDIFVSVGQWYEHFDQVSDEEAIQLLQESYVC